jgi:murein DD-endopeptidase MepM/ murein hydrolase activator NlpD
MRGLRTLADSAVRSTDRKGPEGLLWPISRGLISSGYGKRRDPLRPGRIRFHAGIDLSAGVNEPVMAASAGKVIQAGWNGSAGRTVRLRHPNGIETLYAHLAMVMVQQGQRVGAGDVIGLLGNSGRTTGPHLHFAVFQAGRAIDPLDHLQEVPMSFSDNLPGIVFGWGE